MLPLTFRRATLADSAQILALVTSAYRGEDSRQGWTTEADLISGERIDAELLAHDIRRPDSVVLLAERGADLIGCAHLARTQPGQAYLGMFAVRPTGQNRGDGSAILAAAEGFAAQEWSTRLMTMTVLDARAELLAFYERRGYRRTGTYTPFPYGDARYGVPHRADLRLEVLEKAVGDRPG